MIIISPSFAKKKKKNKVIKGNEDGYCYYFQEYIRAIEKKRFKIKKIKKTHSGSVENYVKSNINVIRSISHFYV